MMVTTAEQTGSSPARGLSAFVAYSLLLHLGVWGAMGLFTLSLWTPELEVTWLDLDNTLGAPRPPSPLDPPPQKQASPTPRPAAPKPQPPLKRADNASTAVVMKSPLDAGVPQDRGPTDGGVPRDQGPADSALAADVVPQDPFTVDRAVLTGLAPGDASLMLLLRMDRVRGSPYEQSVRRLLEVFYDHKTILWSTDVDLVRDFSTLLIATPNPYRVTETFLAGRYSVPRPVLRRALEKAARFKNKRLRWIRGRERWRGVIPSPPKLAHDPREILLDPSLIMLADPKHIPLLEGSSSVDAGAKGGWMHKLSLMEHKGGYDAEGPGMLLQAIRLGRLVRLPPDLPAPDSFQVSVGAADPADLEAVLIFSTPSRAAAFLRAVPLRIAQAKKSIMLRFLGVTALLDAITFKRDERSVYASTTLTGDQVRSLLELFRRMIPQVRVEGMPERRPPDAGTPDVSRPDIARGTGHDAGAAAAAADAGREFGAQTDNTDLSIDHLRQSGAARDTGVHPRADQSATAVP